LDRNSAVNGGALLASTGGQLELSEVTLSNNNASGDGGAIYAMNDATVVLTDSAIISNTAAGNGGGINSEVNVNLFRVTIYNNHAENGGGIWKSTGTLNMENSTISGNEADNHGGGIYNSEGTLLVFHSTIAYNWAAFSPSTPDGRGGGVYNLVGGSFTFQDTILYGNRHRQGISPVADDCNGTLKTQHYNLIGTLAGCTLDNDQGLDLIGVNPLLEVLGDNGGPTETHALGDGSPAIDAADPAGCASLGGDLLTTDQRGYPLPWDGNDDGTPICDIGAYEVSVLLRYGFLPFMVK